MPAVVDEPLFEDEAVTGLVAARPLSDVLETVWDRGGAPAHFVLAYLALRVDPSAEAIRWISVACALALVPVCVDLGRRVAGPVAGAVAGTTVATSGLLAIYGSFGRMYTLFALVAALAFDLFLRALRERTSRAVAAASAAAWLVVAVHPYGAFAVGAEALVALALWRGRRPLRRAVPAALAALAMVPFAVLDLRLANRFSVGVSGGSSIAGPDDALDQVRRAVQGFAGGSGVTLVVFLALAAVGSYVLVRTRRDFAALTLLALGAAPLLFVLVRTGSNPDLSPRHLIYVLPLWSVVVGTGAARALARLPHAAQLAGVTALAVVGLLAPAGVRDPRDTGYTQRVGSAGALAEPARWLRSTVDGGDVLYPYASVYLAALPETGEALTLPRAQPDPILSALELADFPVREAFVAVPAPGIRLQAEGMRARLGPRFVVRRFEVWLLVRARGPLRSRAELLGAIVRVLTAARDEAQGSPRAPTRSYFGFNRRVLCEALRTLERPCERADQPPDAP
ncbi:MAG: glycosyltransferase family 39 protein [Thermoleophilia bacterium]|nr:glycosyltransferase family 39 protein [Thermoleophilia bacterium]